MSAPGVRAGRATQAAAGAGDASWALRIGALAAMGALFFSTYGLANWLAARRAAVPTFAFGWEHAIPFVPWTIVPYWSIDLLYALSFLFWTRRDDLLDHVKRLLTVQLVSVACFIAWPLRFGFARPDASGMAGALFTLLMGFDKPYNQAPSLHIGLLVVLWAVYAQQLRGTLARALLHLWFAAIGVSVLTTYQHHVIDVPTGAAVGCIALFLFPLRDAAGRSRSGDAAPCAASRALARRYARAYGTRAERVLDGAQSLAELGAEVAPDLFDAELRYLRVVEWATCAQDVLWRRSKLGLHVAPGTLDAVTAALDAWFAAAHAPHA
ncbi:phosphatase PAP2 family protein [Burkholderia vietnamiensis]|uniref:phosphatase PAP2 family protein n=1 Tax=Burkholderia vietnamiensis TaxID=60552 RepID=UPI001CB55A8A|nr:membrane hypothetical protein [Burkholderia vietnamiensis]